MTKLRLLDLFSGIGGFSLGLERSGYFETVAFCEIAPYPRRVLAKHWPGVPQYDDICTLTADRLAADEIAIDAICGGFPCQDISNAGKGAGLAGERSGLWREYRRLVGELRPRVVFVENVAALLGRGLGDVLGDLAEIGYDAEWHCIPASAVGAPHQRDRLWIVAYPNSQGLQGGQEAGNIGSLWPWLQQQLAGCVDGIGATWKVEPALDRVVDGVPNRSHRLKALGNAVVPQIPELLGRAYGQAISAKIVERVA
jgi:DNA (cytosine-5)-methyltransferase 1